MKRMLIFMLTMFSLLTTAAAQESQPLTLFAVNVGKGDALLLNAGEDTYLIDAGTAEHWGDLSRALKILQVTRLKGVILTHTDKDHAGGLWALATSSIEVEAWYAPAFFADVKESKHPAVLASALRGQKVNWLRAGDELPLGDGLLKVIGPMSESKTENCNSLVLVAEGGGGRMLLTGDMEFDEEYELLNAGVIPVCEVLKVANHGENDATSEVLVRYVKPKIAVISTSTQEEPDTPATRVLKALMSRGTTVYETQRAGSGVLVTLEAGEAAAQLMSYRELPEMMQGVMLTGRDSKADHIRIVNQGAASADLSGWYIVSDRGGEQFVLPEGMILQPGGEILISTLSSDRKGDLVWPEEKVWHKSKDDEALLYDVYGRLMDTLK